METKTEQTYKPQYQDVEFTSFEDFNLWLLNTHHKKIVFEDHGQDLTKMWIDEQGEILHCNFHASMYNSRFINLDNLDNFCSLEIRKDEKWERMMGLVVESVISNPL